MHPNAQTALKNTLPPHKVADEKTRKRVPLVYTPRIENQPAFKRLTKMFNRIG